MGVISLMVVKDEVIERKLIAVLSVYLPIEESTKRIPLHEAVEQAANLFGSPYKLTLYCWQYKVVVQDVIKSFLDGVPCLECHNFLS